MTKATYMRKRRELLAKLSGINAQIADLDAQPIDAPRPRRESRRRIPSWCKPWWERRDGRQHIVYCTVKRRRDAEPVTAWWLWMDGKPKCKSDTEAGIKQLAFVRSFCFDTFVWDAKQWDEYKKFHPEIEEKLRELA